MIESAYSQQLYRAGDRLLVGILGGLLLLSLALAPLHGTWMAALVIGGSTWLVCGWLAYAHGGALVTRCAIAAALMVFAALEIHQTRGLAEAHFAVFVLLAFLLYYRDWRPLVVAASVIAVTSSRVRPAAAERAGRIRIRRQEPASTSCCCTPAT